MIGLKRKLAKAFTSYATENKVLPVMKICMADFTQMLKHAELAENIFVKGSSDKGLYGTVYGTRFFVPAKYAGRIAGAHPGDPEFVAVKEAAV